MNKKYVIIVLALFTILPAKNSIIGHLAASADLYGQLPTTADDEIISHFEKTKEPSHLKKSKSSIQRVDMVTTATTAQMKRSAPKKVAPKRKRWVIDRIVRRVNGSNILQSDLALPRLSKEGGRYSIDELTMEELLIQKAAELHMLPTGVDIERQLVSFKIQNNLTDMTDDEFEEQLKESGFSLNSYKVQLSRLIAAENVRRVELSERLVIASQEVERFYQDNPAYVPEAYHLSICTVPESKIRKFKEFIESDDATWHDLGLIEKDEIGENFSFVIGMHIGQTSKPFKLDNQNKVIKLLEKQERRLKTLDERYIEIERELQEQRKSEHLNQLEKELREKAAIVDLKRQPPRSHSSPLFPIFETYLLKKRENERR